MASFFVFRLPALPLNSVWDFNDLFYFTKLLSSMECWSRPFSVVYTNCLRRTSRLALYSNRCSSSLPSRVLLLQTEASRDGFSSLRFLFEWFPLLRSSRLMNNKEGGKQTDVNCTKHKRFPPAKTRETERKMDFRTMGAFRFSSSSLSCCCGAAMNHRGSWSHHCMPLITVFFRKQQKLSIMSHCEVQV